jgi:hypothetical protein
MPAIERRILVALVDLHYLSNTHLTRLLVAPTSGSYIREHLAKLEEKGLIRHDFRHLRKTNYGPTEYYYSLTVKGMQWLRGEGIVVPIRTPVIRRRSLHQEHTILVSDTLVTCCAWLREDARTDTMPLLLHEVLLQRVPFPVQVDGRMIRYSPDGMVTMTIVDENPLNLLIECDRGTEKEAQWREKIRCLITGWTGPIAQRFGSDRFTALIVVNTGEGRLEDVSRCNRLIAWTMAELRERRAEGWSEFLLFTSIHPIAFSAEEFFTEEWCRTASDSVVSIF